MGATFKEKARLVSQRGPFLACEEVSDFQRGRRVRCDQRVCADRWFLRRP